MSNTTISIPFNCSFVGFLLFPYKEAIGIPVLLSTPSKTFSLASAVPLKPCSGENTFLIVIFSFESVSQLERIIKQCRADVIYTHWAGDSNQDHIATFRTTMAAARYIPNVYCYEQIPIPRHTENPMRINHYSDITNSFDDKIKAAECHQSQFKKYKEAGFDVTENLTTLAKFRGIQANCQYAEGFQVIKQVF